MELLNAINTAAGDMTEDDMKDSNLFISGKGANHFNTYVSAAEVYQDIAAAFGGTIPDDVVAMFLSTDTGAPVVSSTNAEANLQG
jgi:hypothetical protein